MSNRSHKIAVLSDSHDHLPHSVVQAVRGADEIWHLGDVTRIALLDELIGAAPRLRVVRGNCDHQTDWPLQLDLTLAGLRFRLQHIPPSTPLPENETDVLLHGHTHVPRDETIRGIRYLNPGSVGLPNRGAPASFAWLECQPGQPPSWWVLPVNPGSCA